MGEKTLDVVCLGACAVDYIVRVDKIPWHEGTGVVKKDYIREGGVAANVAVCLSHLGARVGVVSVVGDDKEGSWILVRLGEEDVDSCGIITRRGARTVKLVIVEDDSLSRIFLLMNKDTLSMKPEEVNFDYISRARVLFTDMFLSKTALYAMEKARELGLKVACSVPADPYVMEIWGLSRGDLERAIELSDLAVPSKECAFKLTGERQPLAALRKLASRYPDKVLAVTAGAEGSLVYCGGRILRVSALKVEVADTTGAGDTYMGALIYGLYVRGMSIEDSARLASAAASLKCARPGAWSSPRLEEVEKKLGEVKVEVLEV